MARSPLFLRRLVAKSLAVACAIAVLGATPGAAHALYTVTKAVPIGGLDKWDLLTFDASLHRVYIAHWTETTVVNSQTGAIIGRLAGLSGAHGQAIVPRLGRGYASNGLSGTVTVFDETTLRPVASVSAAEDADVVIYDPSSRRVFVMNGDSGSVTVVETADNSARTIPLGGNPEAGAVDGRGKLYVNIESTSEIIRMDTGTTRVEARWPIPSCILPHGMAIDIDSHRLFTTCANNRMVVVDADSGRLVATVPIGKGTDGAAFDAKRKRIFSSNGDGTLSVIAERGPNSFALLGTVKTPLGARTMTIDPASGRLFLVAGKVAKVGPPKHPGGPPQLTYIPGSTELLILSPLR